MANTYFRFKQFVVEQAQAAMKVTTDGCLFGAWVARDIRLRYPGTERVLDIGTGTGLLSLMIAQQVNASIHAIDIEEGAATQALYNKKNSPWNDRITVFHADAQSFAFPHKYDAIVSNPPFYENDLVSGKHKKDTAHHDAGLTMKQLLRIISDQLAPDGIFYLLLPYKRYEEIITAVIDTGMQAEKVFLIKPSESLPFFRAMIAGRKVNTATETENLVIKNNAGEYTGEFVELLKDYYLYL